MTPCCNPTSRPVRDQASWPAPDCVPWMRYLPSILQHSKLPLARNRSSPSCNPVTTIISNNSATLLHHRILWNTNMKSTVRPHHRQPIQPRQRVACERRHRVSPLISIVISRFSNILRRTLSIQQPQTSHYPVFGYNIPRFDVQRIDRRLLRDRLLFQ